MTSGTTPDCSRKCSKWCTSKFETPRDLTRPSSFSCWSPTQLPNRSDACLGLLRGAFATPGQCINIWSMYSTPTCTNAVLQSYVRGLGTPHAKHRCFVATAFMSERTGPDAFETRSNRGSNLKRCRHQSPKNTDMCCTIRDAKLG